MENEGKEVSLSTLCDGEAVAVFDRELNRAISDIKDLNKSATQKRSIVLTVEIDPEEDRSFGTVKVTCKAKLAGARKLSSRLFIESDNIGVYAYEKNPRQQELPFDAKPLSVLKN